MIRCFGIIGLLVVLLGCKIDPNRPKKELNIVCSTSIIRDCVQEIVGDSIRVQSLMGPGIVEDLCVAYPKYRKQFEAHFRQYRKRVEAEQAELKAALTIIPEERRVLITSHDAFHYFSRCFNVRVRALQGISTTQEPGVQDVVNLVDFIVDHKVKALFVEHSVSPKAINTVIESCQRKGHNVRVGGTLYSDALGDASSPGSTYLRMLRHNVYTLIKGLK
jgi:manganese/zinc/iron transport system substrate-binding protein